MSKTETRRLETLDEHKRIMCDVMDICLPAGAEFSVYALDRQIFIDIGPEIKNGKLTAVIVLMIAANGNVSVVRYVPADIFSLEKPEPVHKALYITDQCLNGINVMFHTVDRVEEVLDLLGYEMVYKAPAVVRDKDGFIRLGCRRGLRNYRPPKLRPHQIRVHSEDSPELEEIASGLASSMGMLIDGAVSISYGFCYGYGHAHTRADLALRMSAVLPHLMSLADELGLSEYTIGWLTSQVVSSLETGRGFDEVPELC